MYKGDEEILELQPEEIPAISKICKAIFMEFNAASNSKEGQDFLLKHIFAKEKIYDRYIKGHHFAVMKVEDKIEGVLEIRPPNHIMMLYVKSDLQGNGLGRKLVYYALNYCLSYNEMQVTLNASREAIKFYQKIGFNKTAQEMIKNGVRYTSMRFLFKK